MNTAIKEGRTPFKMYLLRIPDQVSDCAVASRRTMLETKRRILNKLSARIQRERCVSSQPEIATPSTQRKHQEK